MPRGRKYKYPLPDVVFTRRADGVHPMPAGGVGGPGDADPHLLEEAREDDFGPLRPSGRCCHPVPSGYHTVTDSCDNTFALLTNQIVGSFGCTLKFALRLFLFLVAIVIVLYANLPLPGSCGTAAGSVGCACIVGSGAWFLVAFLSVFFFFFVVLLVSAHVSPASLS